MHLTDIDLPLFPAHLIGLARSLFSIRRLKPISLLIALLSGAGSLQAATITVNTAADDQTANGNCTLREAVQAANTNAGVDACGAGSGADAIVFTGALAGQTISLSINGDNAYGPSAFGITSPITITGDATSGIILQRNGAAGRLRLFRVAPGASLTLQYVTLRDGLAQGGNGGGGQTGGGGGGGLGGAIVNEGTLTLIRSSFIANRAIGGNGGGISPNNTWGGGGGGGMGGDGGGANGTYNGGGGGGPNGGGGGGQNQVGGTGGFGGGGGGGGGQSPGGAGGVGGTGGGSGGGAYTNPGGTPGIAGGAGGSGTPFSTLGLRKAGGYMGGDGGNDTSYWGAAGGGGAGLGGAIYNTGGTVIATDTTFSTNETWGGNGASANYASETGAGGGAGSAAGTLFSMGGSITITASTFAQNLVRGGGGGASNQCSAGVDGGGGGHAYGGAIFGDGATLVIGNSTFSENAAIGGLGGAAFWCNSLAGNGGDARGGAVLNRDGATTIRTSTFMANTVTYGFVGARGSGGGGANGIAKGGALLVWQAVGAASADLSNSVFAGSQGATDVENLGGTVTGSLNLVTTNTGVPGGVILLSSNPFLGPLADNGGPTRTHKPSTLSSPIINAGNCAGGTVTVDQRGVARPQGAGCDLGAFEAVSVVTTPIVVNTAADELNSDGDCTLREAVQASNTDLAVDACIAGSYDDIIQFDPALNGQSINLSIVADSTYGPSALRISNVMTLRPGTGIAITVARDVAVTNLRLFLVTNAGRLTLDNITVSGGRAKGGNGGNGRSGGGGAAGLGGAIFNLGEVVVFNSRLQSNSAVGGNGGAAIDVCCGSGIASGGGGGGLSADGGGGGGSDTGGAGGGPNGGGGGGYGANGNPGGIGGGGGGAGGTNGSVNNAGGPGGWGGGGGAGSYSGYGALSGAFGGGGGGQACCGGDNLDLYGGSGGSRGSYGYGGGGGAFGGGSAIFNQGGTVSIINATLSGNLSTGGNGGGTVSSGGNSGSPGHGGMAGGAVFNNNGSVSCSASTFNGNGATGGNGAGAATSGYNGGNANHARGAALFSQAGSISLTNCTFAGNTATGGTGGNAGSSAGNGGWGQGAAIFVRDAALVMNNNSVAFNSAVAGPKGGGSGGSNGGSEAAGLYVWQDAGTATAALSNNIFSNSTGGVDVQIGGAATATGSLNLIRAGTNVPAGLILTTVDPLLYALGNNGGPTQTLGIPMGSPVVDVGNCAGGIVTVDQRNVSRPQRAACDLGAVENAVGEFDSVAITGANWGSMNRDYTFTATITPSNPAFPITYTWSATGLTDQVHTVSSATDTATFNWPALGAKTVSVTAVNAYGQKASVKTFTVTQPVAVNDTATSFIPPNDNFETNNFTVLPWTFAGNTAWITTTASVHAGTYAARGGGIGNSQATEMQFIKTVPAGTLVFWARVSSEQNYDFLRFYIDGAQQFAISGNGGWAQYTYNIGAGTHTFRWRYDKDGSVVANSDTGFVDDIVFTAGTPQSLNEDTLFSATAPGVLANDTHPFSSALTAVIASGTTPKGALYTMSATGAYTYDPRAAVTLQALKVGQNTTDTFTYTVTDAEGGQATATVTATVDGVNDAPIAAANSYSTPRDTLLTINVPAFGLLGNDTDVETDTLIAVKDTDPTNGILTLSPDGTFTYMPGPGYVGADSFTYHANDGAANSTIVTVSLTVNSTTPGRVPDSGAGHLTIGKNSGTPDTLDLGWGASCNVLATDYAVYQGTLGVWYSHTSAQCSTSGATNVTALNPAAGNTYYLIVPRSAGDEGSYGLDGAGAEIPRPGVTCLPTQINPVLGCS